MKLQTVLKNSQELFALSHKTKFKKTKIENVKQSLVDQVTLKDVVMFLPLNEKEQLHFCIYTINEIDYLEIRKYKKKRDNLFHFTGTKIQFSVDKLEQVVIRLKALLDNKKRNDFKLNE